MISIEKIDKEFVCACTSCQAKNGDADLYEIKIGKTEQQTMTIRLCFDCLANFGNDAYEIYKEETTILD